MKKCDTWRKRCAKSHFLSKNWYLQKLCYMFIPLVLAFVCAIATINCMILAIKAFFSTIKNELLDLWGIVNDGDNYSVFTLWYLGWRFWNQRKAADYLHGLTEEEECGEVWPILTTEQEAKRGMAEEFKRLHS